MKVKKIISGVISAAMVFCVTALPTFATDVSTLKDGNYTANIKMYKDGETNLSMCSGLFVPEVDIDISGEDATINLYVANPLPMFPNDGKDGILKNMKATYNGNEYAAAVDITTRPVKLYKEKGGMGIEANTSHTCDVITLTLPKASFGDAHIDMGCFVNVVMNTDVDFDMVLSNFTFTGENTAPTTPSVEETTKDVTVTATVAASKTDFNVTIPESISFGELSTAENTVKNFDVAVNMTGGNDGGKVKVIAENSGNLVSGSEKIAFANDFGTKEFTATNTQSGSLTVLSDDVKNATPGEYTGTTTFTINYIAK